MADAVTAPNGLWGKTLAGILGSLILLGIGAIFASQRDLVDRLATLRLQQVEAIAETRRLGDRLEYVSELYRDLQLRVRSMEQERD